MEESERKLVADATILGMLPSWMSNFSYNIPAILNMECPHCGLEYDNCKDVRELKPMGGPAIIIGASPAITKLNHLEILAKEYRKEGFKPTIKPTIIVTDKMLIPCLKAGIFPNFVCSVDGAAEIATFYRHHLVDVFAGNTKAVLNSMVHPDVLKEFKGEKYIFHSTLDHDGPTSLTRAIHYMTRNTIIPGTGDVGGFCVHLATSLDFNPIYFIGMSYGAYELEELGDYMAYIKDVPEDKRQIDKFFWKRTHPLWGECWTSMLWESCWDTFKERLEYFTKKKGTRFVNCSGMGLVDSPYVECMDFEKALGEL